MSNAKHKDILWRLNDIADMLTKEGVGGQRIYGCDEFSTPVVNLKAAIAKIEELMAAPEVDATAYQLHESYGDTWLEHPADVEIVAGFQHAGQFVPGFEYEVDVYWSGTQKFRVINDDGDVEQVGGDYMYESPIVKPLPDGYALVPLVPTTDMLACLKEAAPKWNARSIYRAILDAAPNIGAKK